jgi:CheY-like chemotaxis protein
MRILLADDQKDVCLLTQKQLERRGHAVVAVLDGTDALQALKQGTFDAVLLDEEMPGLTGTQVVRSIRASEKKQSHMLVIALTGYTGEPDKERLLAAGFDAVVGKPYRMDILEATLRDAASGNSSRSGQPDSNASSQALVGDPLSRVGGDEQLLAQMARAFLEALPGRLAKLQRSIRQKDGDTLALEAHALKGSFSLFAVDNAVALCKELQECGRSAHFADAARTFAALKEAIAESEANLRGYAEQKSTKAPEAPAAKNKRRPPDAK